MLKIAMLSTGEEVLHGDILDTNAAWLSRLFFDNGFSLHKRSTVGDSQAILTEELLMLSFNNDVVIVNGGLGPTSDDLSAAAAAQAAEQALVLFPEWLTKLEAFFAHRQKTMPESNIKQAMLPEKATILDNPIGTACGFKMQINDCWFYFTPGVPKEFIRMVNEQILPDLKQQFPQQVGLECSKLYTFGSSESGLSDQLDKLQLPEGYTLGYRSYLPFIEVKLFGPRHDLTKRIKLMQIIHSLIEPYVVSIDQPMLEHLGHLMSDKGLSLSIAEQATKGWLSQWLLSNAQIDQLSGHSWILSHQVASELVEKEPLAAIFALAGATKDKCATDLALVTGPLHQDTFCVALSTPQGEWGQQLTFNRTYSLSEQRELIGTIAGDMLRRYLSGKTVFTQYGSVSVIKEMHLPAQLLSISS
ncbi:MULTISPECIES: CinA family nicotinamide mononucleotide deamidase-related protein [unclassified Vibrio]|uniref:CinA family nicotinamide mononucleotide deamidase-related protein n=1 Tax=unclassified Vibrio TaxID=2614977 RepID=UPI00137304C3|nr:MULTISPECIES: CinA family nicotinamide mononucleotide deamidase-related protein [unclassified Vibrio]NAW68605.1 CinA family nicotinamide mononucleotide deamidase-related protein [Vibrio sp. V28_P6S34P95]NAX04507.1 CinA family nicotinamide mononucleotide deamidase-related protein [Vibrio sp. V30_P3S12P165]NAX34564.1 CinA family nicotinamide mononucleotide deamidase-related protein [Vibrio sp. V29_P1S30P107]NAX36760.1 CinA family nicotinamide mononucleotide deamidase-related protein [Vibrio sp